MTPRQARLPGAPRAARQGKTHTHRGERERAAVERDRRRAGLNYMTTRAACPACPRGIVRNAFTGAACDSCDYKTPDFSTGDDYRNRRGAWRPAKRT